VKSISSPVADRVVSLTIKIALDMTQCIKAEKISSGMPNL
jgi:hypothetical protein